MRQIIDKAKACHKHVMACIDGHKVSPTWLRRTQRFGHLVYYGSITFGLAEVHEHIVALVFFLELASVVIGKDEMRDAVIEFE